MRRCASILAMLLVAGILPAGDAANVPNTSDTPRPYTMDLARIAVLKTMLPSSPDYVVSPVVEVRGQEYVFSLRCDHASYTAVSVAELLRLAHEVDVMEHYRDNTVETQSWQGTSESAADIGAGIGNVALHPGDSVRNAMTGAGRATRGVGRFFGKVFRQRGDEVPGGTPEEAYENAAGGILGSERRHIAWELRLDVYSPNPYVQVFLDELARQRMGGRLPVDLGLLALPGSSVLALSMTPGGANDDVELMIRDNNPAELRRINARLYEKELYLTWDAPDSSARALLTNDVHTPREQTYLRHWFTRLATVAELERLVRRAAVSGSPEDAAFMREQIEMLTAIHTHLHRLRRFVPVGPFMGALTIDNDLLVASPGDCLRWDDPGARGVVAELDRARVQLRPDHAIIFQAGDVDPEYEAEARRWNVIVMPHFLIDPRIREMPTKTSPLPVTKPSRRRLDALHD